MVWKKVMLSRRRYGLSEGSGAWYWLVAYRRETRLLWQYELIPGTLTHIVKVHYILKFGKTELDFSTYAITPSNIERCFLWCVNSLRYHSDGFLRKSIYNINTNNTISSYVSVFKWAAPDKLSHADKAKVLIVPVLEICKLRLREATRFDWRE